VYALRLPDARVLVDCGTVAGLPLIRANLSRIGFGLPELTDLLLTHSHWDHAESAAVLQADVPGARMHLNSVGSAYLDRGDYRLVGHQIAPPPYAFRRFRVDHDVLDDEAFAIGTTIAKGHHLPGHTPDSTLYTLEHARGVIGFCGDVVFEPRPDRGPLLGQLCTLWLSDLDDYTRSLERMLEIDLDLLLPGHGNPIRGRSRVRSAVEQTLNLAGELARDPRLRENLGV
jgi:glyoxylase-like metal-dependent hydrolase (beta-lactamase superfamily II)